MAPEPTPAAGVPQVLLRGGHRAHERVRVERLAPAAGGLLAGHGDEPCRRFASPRPRRSSQTSGCSRWFAAELSYQRRVRSSKLLNVNATEERVFSNLHMVCHSNYGVALSLLQVSGIFRVYQVLQFYLLFQMKILLLQQIKNF